MKLNQLIKTNHNSHKRLGRGYGSGRGGHTSSRGAKGDKARGKNKLLFEGVKTKKSLIKRLPFIRGKDKFRPVSTVFIINLNQLSGFKNGDLIDQSSLYKSHIIPQPDTYCKLLANGDVKVALKVAVLCSISAALKIKKAGGEVVTNTTKTNPVVKENPNIN